MENEELKLIKVGDYATECLYTDSHAYEVIKVVSQKEVYIRRLKAIRVVNDRLYDIQKYKYKSDENGEVDHLKFKYKKWRIVCHDGHEYPINIYFGFAKEYYDYTF